MPRIALITDSTCDLTLEELTSLETTMVPLNVHFGTDVYRDHVDLTPAAFLDKLTHAAEMPRTSQPSPALYTEAINSLCDEHDHVLIVALSSKLSGTYQSASLGAADSKIPDKVQVFDSLSASIGLGMQVRRARQLIDSGISIELIVETLIIERSRYHFVFFADTLEYLQRGGRIGKASQLVGSLLKIKPLLLCQEGEVVPFERTRSRSRAIEGIIDFALRFKAIEGMTVLHDGSSGADVERILSALNEAIPQDQVPVSQYGPIVATHVGAGAMGLCLRTAP